MEAGTINETILRRSVTKHIRKHNKQLLSGTGAGDDYAAVVLENKSLICTEGWGRTPFFAWQKAMNNMWVSGGQPVGVRLSLMLPCDIEESDIKAYMLEFNKMADEEKLQIMGGNTRVDSCYAKPSFLVCVTGFSTVCKRRVKDIRPGFHIVMTKYTGILGNDIIVEKRKQFLKTRLSESYIEDGYFGPQLYSIEREAAIGSAAEDVYYIHDASTGGLYGALWKLAAAVNKGIIVNHFDIPIKQHTIEFCEMLNINPYMIDGTGSLLMVARDGDSLCRELIYNGIPARVIGQISDDNDKVISLGSDRDKRYLTPGMSDELYKIF